MVLMAILTCVNFALGAFGLYRMDVGIASDATAWVTAFNFFGAVFCAWGLGRVND